MCIGCDCASLGLTTTLHCSGTKQRHERPTSDMYCTTPTALAERCMSHVVTGVMVAPSNTTRRGSCRPLCRLNGEKRTSFRSTSTTQGAWFAATRHLHDMSPARHGTCTTWHLRDTAPARRGTCATRHLRDTAPAADAKHNVGALNLAATAKEPAPKALCGSARAQLTTQALASTLEALAVVASSSR